MYACTIQIVSLLTSISVRIVTGHMHGVSNEVELQLYVCMHTRTAKLTAVCMGYYRGYTGKHRQCMCSEY